MSDEVIKDIVRNLTDEEKEILREVNENKIILENKENSKILKSLEQKGLIKEYIHNLNPDREE